MYDHEFTIMQSSATQKVTVTLAVVYTYKIVPVISLCPDLTLLFFGLKSSDLSIVKSDRVKSDARSHCQFKSDILPT